MWPERLERARQHVDADIRAAAAANVEGSRGEKADLHYGDYDFL